MLPIHIGGTSDTLQVDWTTCALKYPTICLTLFLMSVPSTQTDMKWANPTA